MNEWKPIETAPTDGTEILIQSEKHGIRVARFQPWSWAPKMDWFIALEPGFSGGMYASDPTHWMPLPEPPQ